MSIQPEDISLAKIKQWDWETCVSMGITLRAYKDASQWALGDLAKGVEKIYGEGTLEKFAREIGINPKTLMEYRRVSLFFPKSKRLPFLSFSHHQRVIKADQPIEVLEMAHDNNWSIKQLDRYLIEEKSADCDHVDEKYNICNKCGRKVRVVK